MERKETLSYVKSMVKECEDYRDDLSQDRTRAIQYYDGIMLDTPAEELRSHVVSRDVRATTKKLLPSIVRTILGNDEVVEYSPLGEGDEDSAQQASDYVNYVILPESGGYDAIHDAIHDAMRLRNGIIKWWYEEKREISVSSHTGLLEEQYAELVSPDDVTVLEHTERPEQIELEGQVQDIVVHDVKIRRDMKKRRPKIACVPLEEFLIHPDATDIECAPIVGQVSQQRRTDLVAMGYDKEKIDSIKLSQKDEEEEVERRGDNYEINTDDMDDPALQEIDYYELYVRTDMDGDGIAELRHMCFAGDISEDGLLRNEYVDDVQFCSLKIERKPHQWEGVSISDDAMELQRINTVLLRQTLDNYYWQNNPQPTVMEGAVSNMEAVTNPAFGMPIFVRKNTVADPRLAVTFNQVPLVADKSFAMLEYMKQEVSDRTGVTDASAGMPPDALQNVTAKASAMMENMGIGQTEQIVRTVATDLKVLFRGLLRMVIRHQDAPRTVRLRDKWVTYDPNAWNAGMDATVNTGLGAGTRERDMMMMQVVSDVQERILNAMGMDNPFVKPDNIYNARKKMIEAAGLRTPGLYLTEPNPEEVQMHIEQERNKPDPEMEKVQAQIQGDQMKMQASAQESQAKLQMQQQQMQLDHQLKREQLVAEMALKREQLAAELELKREQMAAELEMKRELGMVNASVKASAATSGVHVGGEPG